MHPRTQRLKLLTMAALPGLADWLRARLGDDWGARADFARRSGLDPGTVTKLVAGQLPGSRHDTQVKIAQGLGMTHRQLVASVTGNEPAGPRSRMTPEDAVDSDADLTRAQKEALHAVLRSYRRGGR